MCKFVFIAMSKKIKTITCILLLFVCSILETNSQQTYCTPIKTSNNNSFYVSKVSLSDIFNTSDKTAGVYEYQGINGWFYFINNIAV